MYKYTFWNVLKIQNCTGEVWIVWKFWIVWIVWQLGKGKEEVKRVFLKCGAKNAGYTRVGARKKIKKARKNFPTEMRVIKKLRCLKNKIKKMKRKKWFEKIKKMYALCVKIIPFIFIIKAPTLHITLLLV